MAKIESGLEAMMRRGIQKSESVTVSEFVNCGLGFFFSSAKRRRFALIIYLKKKMLNDVVL